MTADSLFPSQAPSSDSPDRAIVLNDTFTAHDREKIASLVLRAAKVVFPAQGHNSSGTLLGDTPQQDFYFHALLRVLHENASSHGCLAVAAHLDDLWAFLDREFENWARHHKGARRLSRESVRQLTSFQWRRAFTSGLRETRIDARTFDDEPAYDVSVQFAYQAATEHTPLVLSVTLDGFHLHGGDPVTLPVAEIPPPCWLPPIENYDVPRAHDRVTEFANVLVTAIKRHVPKGETTLRRALSRVPTRRDRENVLVLQAALRLFRVGDDSEAVTMLRGTFLDEQQETARREGHQLVDEVMDTAPVEQREAFLAAVRMLARGAARAAVAAVLLVILAYFVPSPVQAKVRTLVRRMFDYIVTGSIVDDLQSGRAMFDANRAIFVLADGRETTELREAAGPGILLSPNNDPREPVSLRTFRFSDDDELPFQWLGGAGTSRTGIAAGTYRPAASGTEPWFLVLAIVPQQDEQLASEAAIGITTFGLAVSPNPKIRWFGQEYIAYGGTEHVFAYMYAAFPHIARTYSFIARIHRPSGDRYESVQVSFSANGLPTLVAGTPREPLRVVKKLEWKMRTCATSLLLGHNGALLPREKADVWLWATAVTHEEQTVTFTIAPPKANFHGGKVAIYYGDGTGTQREYTPLAQFTHRYRVGDRRYPVVVFFENSPYEYSREVYVFSDRPPAANESVLTYATPYPADVQSPPWNGRSIVYRFIDGSG